MIDRIRTEFERIDLSEWFLTLTAVVPYAIGWIVGALVRSVLWIVAATIAGYRAGRGDE